LVLSEIRIQDLALVATWFRRPKRDKGG